MDARHLALGYGEGDGRVELFQDDFLRVLADQAFGQHADPVSYTHLTLPTNREV